MTFNLLSILVCPKTGQKLFTASQETVDLFNQCIEKKSICAVNGQVLKKPIDGLLFCDDMSLGYVVRDGLPIMIYDEAIAIQTISDRRWSAHLKNLL